MRLGISAPELSSVCKEVYVETAADRFANSTSRINRSRIAIVTGLTRAEVTRLLKSKTKPTPYRQRQLHRASRVLNGWFTDAEFVSRSGKPRDLPIKGIRRSFEALVKRYSGDIPPRAMLDELRAASAVKRLRDGRIRANARDISDPQLDSREIAALGSQVRQLLETLCYNLENPSDPLLVASATDSSVDPRIVDLLLRRIWIQGTEFLSRIGDQFKHPPGGYKVRRGTRTLGVTVFAHRPPATERRRRGA